MANSILSIYREYLVNVAERECRPFRLPKNTNSLEKRNDYPFFIVLEKKCREEGISSIQDIKNFMKIFNDKLPEFHISYIVSDFETMYEHYKKYKPDTDEKKKIKIKKAFDFLAEYCIINNINNYEDLFKGSPPTILKLWKGGKIDDRLVVKLFDLSRIKNKPWARAYCGTLLSRMLKIQAEIEEGSLSSFIEYEQLKFKNKINN
jgi:hypothetical protein